MIRTFAALAALLTVGAVQAADMNMDMSGHEHHMMAGGPFHAYGRTEPGCSGCRRCQGY